MTPEELLLKAADDIAEHGHNKGTYSAEGAAEDTSPVCAYGAMSRTACGSPNYAEAIYTGPAKALIDQAADLLRGYLRLPGDDADFLLVTEWNDAPETNAEDVILAMKRAASHD